MKSENPGAFLWTTEPWGRALRSPALLEVADHFFTTRDLSLGVPDSSSASAEGWDQVARSIDCGRLVTTRQVHGAAVHDADGLAENDAKLAEADAVITRDPSRAVSVRVADCVPLLMGDPRTGFVAAVHAGWRGTAAGVASATVRALVTRGVVPADLIVAIGPSIGPCCYSVGAELIDAFRTAGHPPASIGRWFSRAHDRIVLDLWAANIHQLIQTGVGADRVHAARLCTACRLDAFHSFRKEGAGGGRLAAVIRPRSHAPLHPSPDSPAGRLRD